MKRIRSKVFSMIIQQASKRREKAQPETNSLRTKDRKKSKDKPWKGNSEYHQTLQPLV